MTAMLRTIASTAVVLSCLLAADAAAQKKQTNKKKAKASEWVAGVAFTTDWKTAIKAVQQSGKMLFIYNGWERKGI